MGKQNEALLEGLEMPEPTVWEYAAYEGWSPEPVIEDVENNVETYTAEQMRDYAAAAMAKKERDMLESANRNGHLATAINLMDALKAENERLRADAEILEWIFDNATSAGGGHGFTMSVHVPVDHEDEKCGIIAAMKGQP